MITIARWKLPGSPGEGEPYSYSPPGLGDTTNRQHTQKRKLVQQGLVDSGYYTTSYLDEIPAGNKYVVILSYYADLLEGDDSTVRPLGIIRRRVDQELNPEQSITMCDRLRSDSEQGLVHWVIANPTEVIKSDYYHWNNIRRVLHAPSGCVSLAVGNQSNGSDATSTKLQSLGKYHGINVVTLNTLKGFILEPTAEQQAEYNVQKLDRIYSMKTNSYTALCYNRILREHRYATVSHIVQSPHRQRTLFSLLKLSSPSNRPYQQVKEHVLAHPDLAYLAKGSKWLAANNSKDFVILDETVDAEVNLARSVPLAHGLNSNFQLVTETFEADYGAFITEKSYKPFYFLQPFVQVGDCGNIAELRKLGYDVFDDVVDHSYDSEPDWGTRIAVALREYDRLCAWSDEQWAIVLRDIAPRLLANLKLVQEQSDSRGAGELLDVLLKWKYS
jgi:hypothetical protein